MMDCEPTEEDEAHSMHDEPSWEIQLEVHIEPMMVEDEQPPLGSATDDEQTYVQIVGEVTLFVDTYPQEMFAYDRIVRQDIGGLEEREDSYQARGMEVHPYLGLPINEMQTNVVTTR